MSGKAYERKSHGVLLKLRVDIPTTEALKGLNQNKFLVISRTGWMVYWLKYKYNALHLNAPGTSELQGNQQSQPTAQVFRYS